MEPIRIYPEYALILTYDIKAGKHERYYRWVTNDFLPALQNRKIYMQHAWHVVGGAEVKPERQVEFITEDLQTLRRLFESVEWQDLEDRLQQFTENYQRRIIKYNGSFKI